MELGELIEKMKELNISIALEENQLKLEIPKNQDDQGILVEVKKNKKDLIALLTKINNVSDFRDIDPDVHKAKPSDVNGGYNVFYNQKKEYLRYIIKGENIFNHSFVLDFSSLNQEALEKAINTMVDRHESLRTTFLKTSEGIQQFIHDLSDFEYEITLLDLGNLESKKQTLNKYAGEHINYAPNFEKGPLFKATIAQFGSDSQYLVFTFHHVISDNTSMEILKKEILEVYEAYRDGRENPLAPLLYQYKDYANWVNNYLESRRGEATKKFYLNALKSSISNEFMGRVSYDYQSKNASDFSYTRDLLNEFQGAFGEDKMEEFEKSVGFIVNLFPGIGAAFEICLCTETYKKLKKVAQDHAKSMFTILTATIALHFYYTNENRNIRILVPYSTRVLREFEGLVGWLISEIIVCLDVDKNLTIKAFLEKVEDVIRETAEHRFYPHEQLLGDLDVPLGVLAPIFINYIQDLETSISDFEQGHHSEGSDHFNYKFEITEFDNGVKFDLHYNPKIISSREIEMTMKGIFELLINLPDSLGNLIGEYQMSNAN